MTEFTDEQLCLLVNKLAPIIGETKALILTEELRPEPKFAKGQVLARKPPNGDTLYFRHGPTNAYYDSYSHRALTLDEMGPLPREMYEMINDAMGSAATDLIKRFKEVHGDA